MKEGYYLEVLHYTTADKNINKVWLLEVRIVKDSRYYYAKWRYRFWRDNKWVGWEIIGDEEYFFNSKNLKLLNGENLINFYKAIL